MLVFGQPITSRKTLKVAGCQITVRYFRLRGDLFNMWPEAKRERYFPLAW